MSFDNLVHYIVNFTSTLNPVLVITLFLISSIGEFGLAIPYLLETIWLLTGYHLATGTLSPVDFILVYLSAEAGRQSGAVALYHVSILATRPVMKLYRRFFGSNLSQAQPATTEVKGWQRYTPARFLHRVNYLSPFSVATGRLLWLRIPLTLTLAVRKDLKTLMLAVLLQSIVWDATYIILGILGKSVAPRPTQMVLYSLGGLTVLYAVTFLVRRLRRRRPTS